MQDSINVTVEKLPKSIMKLTIRTSPADLEASIEKAYEKLAKDVEVKGFRKGTAPRPLVMQELGPKLLDEAMNTLIYDATNRALQQEKINPLTTPEFGIVDSKEGEPLTFTAQFAVYPEVVIGDLKTITIDPKEAKKAEDARKQIQKEQEEHQKEHEENEHEGHDHTHEHEEETSEAPAETPQEAQQESKEPPFNLESYYSDMMEKVFAISQIDLPDAIVEQELENQTASFTKRLEELGIKTEDYLKLQNTTLEASKENWRKDIEFSLKQDLLLGEYAKQKEMKADSAEVEKSLAEVYTPQQRQELDPSMLNYVEYAIVRQKAFLDLIHFIEENNGITHTDSN